MALPGVEKSFLSLEFEVKLAISSVLDKCQKDGVAPAYAAESVINMLQERFRINLADIVRENRAKS
jgi:hypothetical protein